MLPMEEINILHNKLLELILIRVRWATINQASNRSNHLGVVAAQIVM